VKPKNSVQRLYSRRALSYQRVFVEFLGWGRELAAFFQKLDYLRPDLRILDAGCGTGIVTRILYKLAREEGYEGIKFHAFDLTPDMLEIFREWIVQEEAGNIELQQADVLEPESLPSHWKNYNMVVSSAMLEYLPTDKTQDALANLKQLLGPEGILLIIVTRRNFITRFLAAGWWKTNLFEANEVQILLHNAGYGNVRLKKFSSRWSKFIMAIEAVKH
jgi:SAM-dependent methyltransferase